MTEFGVQASASIHTRPVKFEGERGNDLSPPAESRFLDQPGSGVQAGGSFQTGPVNFEGQRSNDLSPPADSAFTGRRIVGVQAGVGAHRGRSSDFNAPAAKCPNSLTLRRVRHKREFGHFRAVLRTVIFDDLPYTYPSEISPPLHDCPLV